MPTTFDFNLNHRNLKSKGFYVTYLNIIDGDVVLSTYCKLSFVWFGAWYRVAAVFYTLL